MLLSIWLLWSGPRDHSPWATGVACRGHWPAWPLGTSSAHCTVHSLPYRLRHSLTDQDRCPTARTAARPIPEGMTIFCLLTASTSQIRTAWLYLWLGAVRSATPSVQLGFLSTNSWPGKTTEWIWQVRSVKKCYVSYSSISQWWVYWLLSNWQHMLARGKSLILFGYYAFDFLNSHLSANNNLLRHVI